MSDASQILSQLQQGDPTAADQLLPLVYDELRRLAAAKLANEKPGQTLQATALVHEAFLRLFGSQQRFEGSRHFFAAAAEAMRRILIDQARRKQTEKHGGGINLHGLQQQDWLTHTTPDQLLVLNEAVERFCREEPDAADLVKLCVFAELSVEEAGAALGISRANAYRQWKYARAWLLAETANDKNMEEK